MSHMAISHPCTRNSPNPDCKDLVSDDPIDYNIKSPIGNSGSIFAPLCKWTDKKNKSKPITWIAGQKVRLDFFKDGVTHNGGHCQFALSYNNGQDFVVFKDILRNCFYNGPVKHNSEQVFEYEIELPINLPSAKGVIFAWTWINAVGNREYYMNCVDVNIVGKGSQSFTGYKLLIANYGPSTPHIPEFQGNYETGVELFKSRPKMTVYMDSSNGVHTTNNQIGIETPDKNDETKEAINPNSEGSNEKDNKISQEIYPKNEASLLFGSESSEISLPGQLDGIVDEPLDGELKSSDHSLEPFLPVHSNNDLYFDDDIFNDTNSTDTSISNEIVHSNKTESFGAKPKSDAFVAEEKDIIQDKHHSNYLKLSINKGDSITDPINVIGHENDDNILNSNREEKEKNSDGALYMTFYNGKSNLVDPTKRIGFVMTAKDSLGNCTNLDSDLKVGAGEKLKEHLLGLINGKKKKNNKHFKDLGPVPSKFGIRKYKIRKNALKKINKKFKLPKKYRISYGRQGVLNKGNRGSIYYFFAN
ncbi:hypothetical protein AYI68_g1258 [Smittium mucronatum]|uniref:Chitin-binding type-4 domain-containing protein n=1 Tax=Smittium mucronatum TaxID=133383 RepID=A0A1R0H661_9FUNG|nr:hypothetical protein AYI68_g1258 [Smittium mucronatum]